MNNDICNYYNPDPKPDTPDPTNMVLKYLGGSKLYGLDNKDSDVDYRGIFLFDDIAQISGFDKTPSTISWSNEYNEGQYTELSKYVGMLRKTNPNTLESLYLPDDKVLVESECCQLFRYYRNKLVDTEKLISSAKGVVFREIKKLKLSLVYDNSVLTTFDSKAFYHMMRITHSVKYFLKYETYPTNFAHYMPKLAEVIIEARKYDGSVWMSDNVIEYYTNECEAILSGLETNTMFKFCENTANGIINETYLKYFNK